MDDTERKIRLDTIIAVSALLVSTLAALSSIATAIIMTRQTQVIAQQFSSTVWPYVAVRGDLSNNHAVFKATNDGLGPAVLRAIVVRVDGKPQRRFSDAFFRLLSGVHVPRNAAHGSLQFSGTTPGQVLRPGESVALMDLQNTVVAPIVEQKIRRISIRLCYCSLLDECWIAEGTPVNRRTADCGDDTKISVAGEDPALLEREVHSLGF